MKKNSYLPIFPVLVLMACDVPEELDDIGDTDDIEFREIHPCIEHKAKLPLDDAGMKALFAKVGVVTEVKVVEDKCRSVYDTAAWAANACPESMRGRWSFWYLMMQMAGTNDPSTFILKMLESFETEPSVNGIKLDQRPFMKSLVVDKWLQKSCQGKPLPCTKVLPEFAPFRLAAIVNRMDLRPDANNPIGGYGGGIESKDSAGEGRFVFTILKDDGTPLDATIILEFALPTAKKDRVSWATDWLALNTYDWNKNPKDLTSYHAKLQTLTDAFVTKGAFLGRPNQGSAINTVRTNEKSFDKALMDKKWSLRQFKLGCPDLNVPNCPIDQRFLVPTTVDLTPDTGFMQSQAVLLPFIDANAVAIRSAQHTVPATFNGVNFLGAESKSPGFQQSGFWAGDLVALLGDPFKAWDTRRMFALATCSGCHYKETQNESNVHIGKKQIGLPAPLSVFLQGKVVTDVLDQSGNLVPFNEPQRRMCELYQTKSGAAAKLTKFNGG